MWLHKPKFDYIIIYYAQPLPGPCRQHKMGFLSWSGSSLLLGRPFLWGWRLWGMLGDSKSTIQIHQICLGRMPLEAPPSTLFIFLLCKLLNKNTGLYKKRGVFHLYQSSIDGFVFVSKTRKWRDNYILQSLDESPHCINFQKNFTGGLGKYQQGKSTISNPRPCEKTQI